MVEFSWSNTKASLRDTIFSFSQRGGHFFQCPSERRCMRLPRRLERLLESDRIDKIYHATLGYADSYFIAYKGSEGNDRIDSSRLPAELESFIYAVDSTDTLIRDIPRLEVILGPYNSSFFAHDGSAYRWMNLPASLLSAIQSRIRDGSWLDKPRIVALGADSNFLLITEKHAAVWDLENYRMLGKMLEYAKSEERGIEEVQAVVLNPYRYHCFVAQSRNGMLISNNIPTHEVADFEAIRAAVKQDTEAKRGNQSPENKERRPREARRKSNLNRQATLRREWSDRKEQMRKEAGEYKLKLSLTLNITPRSIARMLG